MKKIYYFVLFVSVVLQMVTAQTAATLREWQFMSYGKIPTWTGIAVDWQTAHPTIHLYDNEQYKGHATFVMNALKQQLNFSQFKNLVREADKRQYVPFFLYDLRTFPIQEKGKTYDWALMVEDYGFTDSDEQIAQMIVRLASLVPSKVPFEHDGILLLANNPANKVNMRLTTWLRHTPYLAMTSIDLQQKTNSRSSQILNEGSASGLLHLVNNDREAQQLRPNDIAVYAYIPLEVPPVAGIITLFPQTPLSHTAILAKNRGTPNVYVPSLRTIQAERLTGKQVLFVAKKGKISLQKLSSNGSSVAKLPVAPPKTKIWLPPAKGSLGNEVVSFVQTASSLLSIENIGTKAANYARLQRLLGKEVVREGFALGFNPYLSVVSQQAKVFIDQLYEEKSQLSPEEIRLALSNIRTCIEESKVPVATIESLRKLMEQHFPDGKIRLRSSTNCEDLPNFNGAGLYESKGVESKDSDKQLAKKLLKVYASLWNEHAFLEREYFDIDHRTAAMAIQINEAFDNEQEIANGVIATKVLSNNHLQIWVNAQRDSVLVTNPTQKGETPESFYTNRQGKIEQVLSESSLGAIFVGQTERQILLRQLAELAEKTHVHFVGKQLQYGVDIEFKIMATNGENRLYFKQARLLRQH